MQGGTRLWQGTTFPKLTGSGKVFAFPINDGEARKVCVPCRSDNELFSTPYRYRDHSMTCRSME